MTKLDKMMLERTYMQQKPTATTLTLKSDDGKGIIPIVMGYMDNINALVSVHDASSFVDQFKKLGIPLGAILNKEKTQVMTSVSRVKLTERLPHSDNVQLSSLGREQSLMIQQNTITKGTLLRS